APPDRQVALQHVSVNMEEEEDKETLSGEVSLENVSFSQVSAVATGWMFDFMFVSLCRHFKEEKYEDFNELISTLQVVSKTPSLKRTIYQEKTLICAFLSRLIHGEHLDVQFEEDESVTPLMSAAQVWSSLKGAVADDSLFDNITVLLLVQVDLMVCDAMTEQTIKFDAQQYFLFSLLQKLRDKLSKIVDQKDTYHPFLMSFSFSRLLETVQIFLDAFLEKNPSDYLLKVLLSFMLFILNECGRLDDLYQLDFFLSVKFLMILCLILQNGKWTAELDKYLKDGVKRHGVGKWSRILMDYDFDGRTGTMLKDRWRILLKAHEVE
uniref:Uncharacterized protein n=1 Tax=Salarias fasciatus TaxID=181472 RepID=A0A672JJ47_SALFA